MKSPLRGFVSAGCAAIILIAAAVFAAGCARVPSGPAAEDGGAHSDSSVAMYYCPMHPNYTSPKPGLCPICNMNLVPMDSKDPQADHAAAAKGDGHACCPVPGASKIPEGYAVVSLSAGKRQLIGVKTDVVRVRHLSSTIRTAGLALPSSEVNLFVYESDLPLIANDAPVEAYFPALGRKLKGVVSRIPLSLDRGLDPSTYGPGAVLNAGSNQVTVRARFEDPDRLLRRGMTADAQIRAGLGEAVALPEEAVLFTGKRAIVFVQKSEGVYEPREVVLGRKAAGHYAVQTGVLDGETVVTNGNFLIDSESRLRSAFEAASSGSGASSVSGADQAAGSGGGHAH